MTESDPANQPTILPLGAEQAFLSQVGGKGANLSRLARLGLPVPPGFQITTQAYCAFVAANHLREQIEASLQAMNGGDPAGLERASSTIRSLFSAGSLPPGLARDILAAYDRLGRPPVAVRSSATAEDLPEMSFAGQQDTYLNVAGETELLQAVIDCWSSLWTARAIGYRERNGVDHAGAALAVVVQSMVQSQASGVLFTANPLTGLRSETVIDATLGLGEALVSGQVEPDHYVVDSAAGRIVTKTLGSKSVRIQGRAEGGTVTLHRAAADSQALPDEQILALARLGQQVANQFGYPQDIEWAWADERLFLLQTRPITSLFPVPHGLEGGELKVLFSFAAVQGLLDPLTPLGQDVLKTIFAFGARIFRFQVTAETQAALYSAGERLWINITPVMRNTVGRKILLEAAALIEPGVGQALQAIRDDPRLQPAHAGMRPRTLPRLARFFLPLAWNMILNLISPEKRRKQIVGESERILEQVQAQAREIQGDRFTRLDRLAELLPWLADENLPRTFVRFVSLIAAGMASFNLLNRLSKGLKPGGSRESGWDDLVLEVSRGIPDNPTTEMDLALWRTARQIRQDPASRQVFRQFPAAELAVRYQAGDLPAASRQAIGSFLARYGERGLGEVDTGRPRWREDPAHIIETLRSYLQIEDDDRAPDAVFARSAQTAERAVAALAQAARQSRGGWLKAPLVRFFAGRARALLGARENPKFFAVRMMGILRRGLLEVGEAFVQAGELERQDDLFFLSLAELKAFARQPAGKRSQWVERIAHRRENYRRELRRRQIPRLLLSDGRAFYAGMRTQAEAGQTLTGSPVSPGKAAGRVRVVLDPRQADLRPGEILVCPGTDPSWTPLFLSAAGLVMEVGGMMTHGAVVAREYGIPAIVGVDQATRRLQTGQQVQIDGSTGQIILLSEDPIS